MDIPLSGLSTTFIDELAEYYQGRSSTSGMKLRRLGNVLPERNERGSHGAPSRDGVPLAIGDSAALPASETVQLYPPLPPAPSLPYHVLHTCKRRPLTRSGRPCRSMRHTRGIVIVWPPPPPSPRPFMTFV